MLCAMTGASPMNSRRAGSASSKVGASATSLGVIPWMAMFIRLK